MGKPHVFHVDPRTGVPRWTAHRLTSDFLQRHGAGLDDLLRRFPAVGDGAFREAIERSLTPGETVPELVITLEEATDTLLALRDEDALLLPVDAGQHINIDAGLRWYAARFRDLSKAAQMM